MCGSFFAEGERDGRQVQEEYKGIRQRVFAGCVFKQHSFCIEKARQGVGKEENKKEEEKAGQAVV